MSSYAMYQFVLSSLRPHPFQTNFNLFICVPRLCHTGVVHHLYWLIALLDPEHLLQHGFIVWLL